MNVLLPFEEGSFTLVMAKTHLFIIKLVKMQSHSGLGFFCFYFCFICLYKRSCSGINFTFIVWCADKVGLEKYDRKMEPEAQSEQVSLIE